MTGVVPAIDDLVPTRAEVGAARERIAGYVRRTPVLDVDLPGAGPVALKLELLQHTGSFKPRGAFLNVLDAVDAGEAPGSLVAASGGNHGLAVAHVGAVLGVPTRIFVPSGAPAAKVGRLRTLGAEVTLSGATYADARAASTEAAAAPGALAVHAYDGRRTLAGQGTLGLELEEQVSTVDTVVVAVGGGGLVGGVAAWWAARACVVAVEPVGAPTLHAALDAGEPVDVTPGGLASDALGASRVGESGLASARRAGVRSVLVEPGDIAGARALLWRETRLAAEPGGATALAALTAGRYRPEPGERVAVVVCGGNADPGDLPLD